MVLFPGCPTAQMCQGKESVREISMKQWREEPEKEGPERDLERDSSGVLRAVWVGLGIQDLLNPLQGDTMTLACCASCQVKDFC